MTKKLLCTIAILASVCAGDMATFNTAFSTNTCAAAPYDANSDGFIPKGTIYLTRVVSGKKDRFYLYNKRGVDYVASSKCGPFYRLSSRMTINGIDYKL